MNTTLPQQLATKARLFAFAAFSLVLFCTNPNHVVVSSTLSTTDVTTSNEIHAAGLEAYSQGDVSKAERLIRHAVELSPKNFNFYNTLGELLRQQEQHDDAITQYLQALSVAAGVQAELVALVWINLGTTYLQQNQHVVAQDAFERALTLHSHNRVARFRLSYTFQLTGQLDKAYESYRKLLMLLNKEELRSTQGLDALLNMGTLDILRGNFEHGMELYQQVLTIDPNNSKALNNIGAQTEEFVDFDSAFNILQRAIRAAPEDYAPHVNVAALCYQHGDVSCSRQAYQNALALGGYAALEVRLASLMAPIMGTWNNIDTSRTKFQYSIACLHARWQKEGTRIMTDPAQSVEWLHYYPQYHGLSEYSNQVMMATFYTSMTFGLQWVAPHLQTNSELMTFKRSSTNRIKIGFMSKFFGVGQPHGLLLEGVVANLPRDVYEVIVFEVPGIHSTLNPIMLKTADQIVRLPLVLSTVQQTLASHNLDVLVLADGMSEPINYFVAIGTRVAPVQCMFWGNPLTTGGSNIDYFISGDRLETDEGWREYSEQLVRLEGQAIWYKRPTLPRKVVSSAEVPGLTWRVPGMVVYVCPQSTFKIHPDFIDVVQAILKRIPHAHLIFLKGRKKRWTNMLQQRLEIKLPQDVYMRVHFLPRMSRLHYLRLVGEADIMLHPFPFGGSKTSADGIAAGVPVVCLKTKYLRGRMAYSYFVTMKYEETVTETQGQYIEIAVKLGLNLTFREAVSREIRNRSALIWERQEYVNVWNRFLKRATQLSTLR